MPRPVALAAAPAALLVAAALLAGPAAAAPSTAEEIQDCMRRNLPERTAVQTIRLRAVDRTGAVNESEARIYWENHEEDRSRLMMRFSAPADMRGAALLILQQAGGRNDMFMYLPELKRVRRVTGRMLGGSMFGTDFSYEEFERLQGLSDDVAGERLADAEVNGRAAFVLQHRPDPETSATDRVLTYVDRETCVPLRLEFFERGDSPRKVLTTDFASVQRHGERWIPHRLTMRDERDRTETHLVVEEIELDARISPKMFSQRELEAGS